VCIMIHDNDTHTGLDRSCAFSRPKQQLIVIEQTDYLLTLTGIWSPVVTRVNVAINISLNSIIVVVLFSRLTSNHHPSNPILT
jgi:hypothetical protein